MSEQPSTAYGDDPGAVGASAVALLAEAESIWSTASAAHTQWRGLALAYRGPEAEAVLRAMDAPLEQAERTWQTSRAVDAALRAYAERLQAIRSWAEATGTDAPSTRAARQHAEETCAAAVAALVVAYRCRLGGDAPTPPPLGAGLPAPPGRQKGRPGRLAEPAHGPTPSSPGSDVVGWAFSSTEMVGLAASTHASWMVTVEHGIFRPRAASGRFVSPAALTPAQRLRAGAGRRSTRGGTSRLDRLRSFEPGGNVVAKGHRRAAHERWARTATRLGRANTAVSVAGTGWSQWQRSAGETTDRRVGRTAAATAATAGGAWAGGQAGAWAGGAVGTAVLPGAGTVVGAAVGGVLGSLAGSEAGSWVGEQVEELGADAGELASEGVGWLGDRTEDVGTDVLDTLAFWS